MNAPQLHTEFFSAAHYAAAYTFSPPPEPLAGSVEYVWHSRFDTLDTGTQPEVQEQLLAHLSCSLVFSTGDAFRITQQGHTQSIGSDAVLIGHHTGPVRFSHFKANRLTGVKLRPGAFYRLSGIHAEAVRDQVLPLCELAPGLYHNLQQKGLSTGLCAGFHPQASTYKYDAVHQALQLYLSALHQNPCLEQIAAHLYLSPRTLNRYFHEVLGLGPRKVFSIARLRRALSDRTATQPPGKPFSFYDYGYADHSHFYKDLATYAHLKSLQPT